jgi:guanylate kinase
MASEVRDYAKTEELKNILNDFTSSVLLQKPDDIYTFAREYFSQNHLAATSSSLLQNNNRAPVPIVITGPSGVGKGTCTYTLQVN